MNVNNLEHLCVHFIHIKICYTIYAIYCYTVHGKALASPPPTTNMFHFTAQPTKEGDKVIFTLFDRNVSVPL